MTNHTLSLAPLRRSSKLWCGLLSVAAWGGAIVACAHESSPPKQERPGGSNLGGAPSGGSMNSSGGTVTNTGGGSPNTGGTSSGGTTGGGGTTSGNGGMTGGTGATGSGGNYCDAPNRVPEPIPLVVSSLFSPDGYMGDYEQITALDCEDRADGAAGECYSFEYDGEPGAQNWAGVAWLFPAGNWGDSPGLCIAEGATKIGFWARGHEGGELVNFAALGRQTGDVALSDEWTYYELSLAGVDYNNSSASGGVANGFSWAAAPPAKRIYIDDIRWLP